MSPSQYVIGIDGGGTKTTAIIAGRDGEPLAKHTAGPSNGQVIGFEKAARIIASLVRKCISSVGCSSRNIHGITIGLAGAGRPDDRRKIAAALRQLASTTTVPRKRIRIESDARIALEGAFDGGAGIVVIAGTGSIAVGKDAKGNIHRSGGWGRILGDEGSGYCIGRDGLNAICRSCDGRSAPTLLSGLAEERFGLKTAADIVTAVYQNSFDIASLAPIVFEAAESGDAAATEIVERAARELTEQVRPLLVSLRAGQTAAHDEVIKLSFLGGLIENETPLRRTLRQQILASFSAVDVVPPFSSPAAGAVLMALQ